MTTELASEVTITKVSEDMNSKIGEQVDLCVQQANDITIEDAVDLDNAAVFVRGLKTILSRINDTFDRSIALANKTHKEIIAAKKAHADPIKRAEIIVKDRIGQYQMDQERIQRAEQKRLRAQQEDRERKAREEEAERQRKLREEEEARLAEAQRLEDEGKAAEAEAVLDAAPPEAAPIVPEHVPPPKAPAMPKAKGISMTSVWKWTIINVEMIPREFLMVDEKALNAHVRAKKGDTRVAGISVHEEKQVGARSL